MNTLRRPAALVLTLLVCAAAHARAVSGLYTATVPVTDRSQAEFARGVSEALSEVLVKITGQRRPADNAAIKPVLGHARALLVQYGYEQRPGNGELRLKAEFDERALSAKLQSAGIALWSKERPDTLVWLLVDDGTSRHVIASDDPGSLGDVVTRTAAARGVPVLLPLMDIGEAQQLNGPDVGGWPQYSATAVALSARYQTPATLIGYLRQSVPGLWEAHWEIRVGNESFQTRGQGDVPDLVVEDGVEQLADALARRYAGQGVPGQTGPQRILVYGLDTADDYARAAHYLSTLDIVTGVFVRGVDNQRVAFDLTAQGGAAALAQSISFGQVLVPVAGRPGAYQLLR